MAERYAHLARNYLFEAVQRINRRADEERIGTATGTEQEPGTEVAGARGPARRDASTGRYWDRTSDPRLVRPMLSR